MLQCSSELPLAPAPPRDETALAAAVKVASQAGSSGNKGGDDAGAAAAATWKAYQARCASELAGYEIVGPAVHNGLDWMRDFYSAFFAA